MSATEVRQRLSKLAEWRGRLTELSSLQRHLRAEVKSSRGFFSLEGALSFGELARRLKVNWHEVDRFLGKGKPCGGRLLERLGKVDHFAEVCTRIKRLSAGVPDRVRGLAAFSAEVIDLALDLHKMHLLCQPECSQTAFAAAFTPHSELVAGVFNFSEQAFRALEDDAKREEIRAKFADGGWRTELELVLRDQSKTVVLLQAELHRLVEQLLPTHKLRRCVAAALKVHRTTLTLALKGKAGEALRQLVERARALVGAQAQETAGAVPTAQALEQLGGETSPLGVRFVLGPQSFREIEGDLGDEGIAYIRRIIELARLLLNLCAQLKDEAVRGRVRESLLREVEELQLAIRLFTVHFPNQLTALHQDQRLTWFRRVKQSGPQPKPKRR
ncbi:hypothetical protein HY442_02430 [Candidatus Parcubacteria bacterium]|nr:hypothetical protein [Candidatus Parcubacteria bacterium]